MSPLGAVANAEAVILAAGMERAARSPGKIRAFSARSPQLDATNPTERSVWPPPAADDVRSLPYVPALDGLRALAVLAVIAYHDEYPWARGGFLGVDAFFVLSGFLITTLLLAERRGHGRVDLPRFWVRRLRRLLPASLAVLLFVAVYTATVIDPQARRSAGSDGLAALFYVANWRFVWSGQSYFELFGAPSPLRHVWSLAIEEQFYLLWPIVVAACLGLGRGSRRVLTITCSAGILASLIVMVVVYDERNPSRAYYGTDARVHALLIGCLLGIFLFGRRLPYGRVLRGTGIAAALLVALAANRVSATDSFFYRGGSAVFAVLVALVIMSVLAGGGLARVMSVRPLVWVGTISYGLYLWHWPINIWLVESRLGVGGTPLNLIRLAATFGAATASFYLLERPIRRGRLPTRVRPWAAPAAIIVTGGVILGSMAGAADNPGYFGGGFGFPSRCRPQTAEFRAADVAAERKPSRRSVDVPARRILLIGDSTACSLYPGLRAVGRAEGFRVDQAAVVGCGVVSDEVTSARPFVVPLGTEQCHGRVDRALRRAFSRSHPDLVVWLSVWEKSDLRVGGRVLRVGSPEAERTIVRRAKRMVARVARTGARVVVATVAPRAPGVAFEGVASRPTAVDDRETTTLNELLVRVTSRHPSNVSLVDLAALLCPAGPPCPERVDDFRPRPDGNHFSPAGAVWAARWLLAHLPPQPAR